MTLVPVVPESVPVPDRPRLARPTWRRGPDAVQFGTRGDRALVLDGLTPPLVRMVVGLDGTRGLARVVAEATAAGASPDAARALLDVLHHAGLLRGADEVTGRLGPGGRTRGVVVVHGAGRVGVALACLLAASGVGRVRVAATGTVLARDTGTGLLDADVGRPAVHAAADAVTRSGGPALGDVEAARRATVRPDLIVLTAGRHPDPVVAAELATSGRPHLVVGVDDLDDDPGDGRAVGVVGPLVLPGRTACLRCDDLARTAVDPAWPRVAADLAGARPAVPPALAAAVAAVAADHALALLDTGFVDPPAADRPASLGAQLLLDPRRGTWRTVPRPAHPACGCGAPVAAPGRVTAPLASGPVVAGDVGDVGGAA